MTTPHIYLIDLSSEDESFIVERVLGSDGLLDLYSRNFIVVIVMIEILDRSCEVRAIPGHSFLVDGQLIVAGRPPDVPEVVGGSKVVFYGQVLASGGLLFSFSRVLEPSTVQVTEVVILFVVAGLDQLSVVISEFYVSVLSSGKGSPSKDQLVVFIEHATIQIELLEVAKVVVLKTYTKTSFRHDYLLSWFHSEVKNVIFIIFETAFFIG